jgi:hypothetical protein
VILYPLAKGGATVIVRGWDIQLVGESIKKYQINMIAVVPPVMLLMAKHPAFDKFDFSVSFRVIYSANLVMTDLTPHPTVHPPLYPNYDRAYESSRPGQPH